MEDITELLNRQHELKKLVLFNGVDELNELNRKIYAIREQARAEREKAKAKAREERANRHAEKMAEMLER